MSTSSAASATEVLGARKPAANEVAWSAVRPSMLRQWWVLTGRGLTKLVRNGGFVFAFLSPAILAVCYYIPLRKIMDVQPGMDYAQFLAPIILLQSMGFAAMAAAMRSAVDGAEGIATRYRVMPMPAAVPMLARTATSFIFVAVSLVCAAIASLVMGWRPDDGALGVVVMYGIGGITGVLLCLAADGIGLVAHNPQATSQAIALPTLILGMLSTGLMPVERFPDWIQPFVRNQPISQFVNSIRAADTGTLTWPIFQPTLWWWIGILGVAAGLLALHVRRLGR